MIMVMSMTGYGISEFHVGNTTCTIEIKTINSRYLDFVPKMPRILQAFELDMKQLIQRYFLRGRVEVYVSIAGDAFMEKELHVDEPLLQAYLNKATELMSSYGLKNDLSIHSFIHHEDIFSVQEKPKKLDAFQEKFFHCMEDVLNEVKRKREEEANFLLKDIMNRLHTMKDLVEQIKERAPIIMEAYKSRIQERIETYIGEHIQIEGTNVLQEIALLAEKGEITEEITRLQSHFRHFTNVLKEEGAVGRKLDFINQEIHREINTIGSKSIDPLMSELVVTLKSENEKIKEQVQNIE